MILQALTDYYQVLEQAGKIAAPGWKRSDISFVLCISDTGNLEQIVSIRNQVPQGKRMVLRPQPMVLPAPADGRTSTAVRPNFLWDKSDYLLGISKGGIQRGLKYFNGSKEYHETILSGIISPAASALLEFFQRWNPEKASEHPLLQDVMEDILKGANMVFRYSGGYIHADTAIKNAWQKYYTSQTEGEKMTCLVTGEQATVARIHPKIKGIINGEAMGNTLVGFNFPSVCSYGKEQSYNAPVGQQAVFAYTAALNHLLSDRDHIYQVGDATVVCWARGGGDLYQSLFGWAAMGQDVPSYDEGELRNLVKRLCQGEPVLFHEERLDPNMDFYILGLSPNAARLSVRFFLHNTFGGFLSCVQEHYKRLAIVPSRFDQREFTPVWRLLYATIRSQLKFEPESFETARPQLEKNLAPNLTGEVLRSILTGTRYPSTLYSNVLLRIFAEQKVDRTRAAIIKAYLLKNHPDKTGIREEMNLPINYNEEGSAFLLGCLFALLEKIQIDAIEGINQTLVDKFLPTAASTPHLVFDSLLEKSRYHLRKLGGKYGRRKDLQELLCAYHQKRPGGFPQHLSHTERGDFMVGYYLKNQELWQSKSEQKKEETKDV